MGELVPPVDNGKKEKIEKKRSRNIVDIKEEECMVGIQRSSMVCIIRAG